MLRPDRRITLLEPAVASFDSYGEEIPGDPIEHVRLARRRDRGGREVLVAETSVGEWTTSWVVRMQGLESLTREWGLRDERDIMWDIETVNELPFPPRRYFDIRCTSRE